MENSSTASCWGLCTVSEAVTDTNMQDFFDQHGLYYQEDAVVGEMFAALDQQGLFNSIDSFKRFSDRLLSDSVSEVARQKRHV